MWGGSWHSCGRCQLGWAREAAGRGGSGQSGHGRNGRGSSGAHLRAAPAHRQASGVGPCDTGGLFARSRQLWVPTKSDPGEFPSKWPSLGPSGVQHHPPRGSKRPPPASLWRRRCLLKRSLRTAQASQEAAEGERAAASHSDGLAEWGRDRFTGPASGRHLWRVPRPFSSLGCQVALDHLSIRPTGGQT